MTPSPCGVTTGFPIRTSPDHGSFDSSPGLIAAYHVLHRLSTPRHPPCTLSSLVTWMTNRPCVSAPPARTMLPRHLRRKLSRRFERDGLKPFAARIGTYGSIPDSLAHPPGDRSSRPPPDVSSTIRLSKSFIFASGARRFVVQAPKVSEPIKYTRDSGFVKAPNRGFFTFSRDSFRVPQQVGSHRPPVEPSGLEPPTSWLQTRRSPS